MDVMDRIIKITRVQNVIEPLQLAQEILTLVKSDAVVSFTRDSF
jgi:hypothetical protein